MLHIFTFALNLLKMRRINAKLVEEWKHEAIKIMKMKRIHLPSDNWMIANIMMPMATPARTWVIS